MLFRLLIRVLVGLSIVAVAVIYLGRTGGMPVPVASNDGVAGGAPAASGISAAFSALGAAIGSVTGGNHGGTAPTPGLGGDATGTGGGTVAFDPAAMQKEAESSFRAVSEALTSNAPSGGSGGPKFVKAPTPP